MHAKPTYEDLEKQILKLKKALQSCQRTDKILKNKCSRCHNLIDQLRSEGEERFRVLADDLPALVCEFLPDSMLTFANKAYCEFFAKPIGELIGRRFLDFIPEEEKESVKAAYLSLTPHQPLRVYTHKVIKNGELFWQEWRDRAIFDDQGRAVQYRSVGFDITDRKRAEAALRENEEKYRLLFELESDAIFLIEMDAGNILEANASAADLYGFSRKELLSMKITDLWAEAGKVEHVKQNQYIHIPLGYHRKKDGTVFPVEIIASHLKWKGREDHIVAIRDIASRIEAETARSELEKQLNQAQKMEAIGTLASGIAHNFNNVLMGIQGRASLMIMDKNPSHPDYEHLMGIERCVKSAADLTRDLLGFARGGKYEVKPTALNALIMRETRMFASTKKEIRFHEDYAQDLWTVDVDQGQIRQALLNLYMNAWQAMPGGGHLYIQTMNITLGTEYFKSRGIPPGKFVKISMTDTGTGLDDAIRERIFDPFFSTRESVGFSYGLGLASVYGIIKNHGGFINVFSQKGEGTTFTVYLPASIKEAVKESSEPVRDDIQYGEGTILLIDDEDMIIRVAREGLERLGYRVVVAASGEEALDIYGEKKEEIDLIILDMIMPDMGGGETFDRLKAIDGNVKVLLSSGYSINGQAREILDRGCNDFIQKPFTLEELSQKVKEVIGR